MHVLLEGVGYFCRGIQNPEIDHVTFLLFTFVNLILQKYCNKIISDWIIV